MGIFNVPIEVGDPEGGRFERVEALVDTGATFTIVPAPFWTPWAYSPSGAAPSSSQMAVFVTTGSERRSFR